jgi:hypothetical protein
LLRISRITASTNNQINFFATDLNGLNGLSQIFQKQLSVITFPSSHPFFWRGLGGGLNYSSSPDGSGSSCGGTEQDYSGQQELHLLKKKDNSLQIKFDF